MQNFQIENLIDLLRDGSDQDNSSSHLIDVSAVNSSFEELGLDSLALLSVVAQLEKRLSISIGFSALAEVRTPSELFDLIRKLLASCDPA